MSAEPEKSATPETYLLWLNEERTMIARLWPSGVMEVATREDPSDMWGPPVKLEAGSRV